MLSFSLSTLTFLSVAGHAFATSYSIADTYQANSFLSEFDFFTANDPTNGYVCAPSPCARRSVANLLFRSNYVSKADAIAQNLVQVSGNNFTLRADDQNVPSATARGRDSVRITSQKSYTTHVSMCAPLPMRPLRPLTPSLVISYNVAHMPKGCGTWPAIWEVGDNWPNNGEVDIVEGACCVSRRRTRNRPTDRPIAHRHEPGQRQHGIAAHGRRLHGAGRARGHDGQPALERLRLVRVRQHGLQRAPDRRGQLRTQLQHQRRRLLRDGAREQRHQDLVLGARRHERAGRGPERRHVHRHEHLGSFNPILRSSPPAMLILLRRARPTRSSRRRAATSTSTLARTTS
jgi:hypothetical protein